MRVKKFSFMKSVRLGLLLTIVFIYLIYKVDFWIEDRAINKSGIEDLIVLLKQPNLKQYDILYFYGSHEGRERDNKVRNYVFFSKAPIEFQNLSLLTSSNKNDDSLYSTKKYIEGLVSDELGHAIKCDYYYNDYNNKMTGNITIKLHELQTTKGFYTAINMLEKN